MFCSIVGRRARDSCESPDVSKVDRRDRWRTTGAISEGDGGRDAIGISPSDKLGELDPAMKNRPVVFVRTRLT